MPKRIKILFFYSNPQDQSRICLDEEVREIEQAIEASKFSDEVDLQVIHAPGWKTCVGRWINTSLRSCTSAATAPRLKESLFKINAAMPGPSGLKRWLVY